MTFLQDINESSNNLKNKRLKEDVFNIILEYINAQLFPAKNDDTDILDSTLDKVLKITPAPMCRTRTFTKSSKSTRSDDKNLYHDHFEDDSLDLSNIKQHEQNISDKSKPETIRRNKHSSERYI